MADKEYLLGNRARELLRYTKQETRPISDEVSRRDVRAIIKRIAELPDIQQVRAVSSEVIRVLDESGKDGFTKSAYRLYGEDMREIAKGIVRDIHCANDTYFQTHYEERLEKIDDIIAGCSLLLEYILICTEDNIISVRKSGLWTKKVSDVKNMALAWKKNDGGRARKLRDQAQADRDARTVELVKTAIRQYKAGK